MEMQFPKAATANDATADRQFTVWLESTLNSSSSSNHINGASDQDQEALIQNARQWFQSQQPQNNEFYLARLLKTLGPGLTAPSMIRRIASLNLLLGALEGTLEGRLLGGSNSNSSMSLATIKLLLAFFLEQCAPISTTDDDHDNTYNYAEDHGEQIRDLCLKCLSATLNCYATDNTDTDAATAAATAGGAMKEEFTEAIILFCSTARQAVERRCALPAEDDDLQSYGLTGMGAMAGGELSTLPRSRRSMCFDVLRSTVDCVDRMLVSNANAASSSSSSSKLTQEVSEFIKFACSCLQGESDPRCLMQLLVLFRKIQVVFQPIFLVADKKSSTGLFPTTEVFDAVAPYYPINFTPPPHDNHGITRAGLKNALLAILCGLEYDDMAIVSKNQDTMVSLSLGIILERLIPVDGDTSNMAQTTDEKREALSDLNRLLFPEDSSDVVNVVVERLASGNMAQLRQALVYTHQEAAIAVSQGGGLSKDMGEDKQLADDCRSLIAKVANTCEAAKEKVLWNIFVKDSVVAMSGKLESNSLDGRLSITYLASLAACGGPQTLRFVLDNSLENLIRKLEESLSDEESATMASYGIGALCSSCNVAMEKAMEHGLALHPHPMEKFCSRAFQALYNIISESDASFSPSLKTATLLAIEALLNVSPAQCFDELQTGQVSHFISSLTADLSCSSATKNSTGQTSPELMNACAQTLGSLLGKSFAFVDDMEDGEMSRQKNILSADRLRSVLQTEVLNALLAKSKESVHRGDSQRYELVALARACSSKNASARIFESLLEFLKTSIDLHSLGRQTVECARSLFFVLEVAGPRGSSAIHKISHPQVTMHDVLDALCMVDPRSAYPTDKDVKKDVTALNLPATADELKAVQCRRQDIVLYLSIAYQSSVPAVEIAKLLSVISNILPPLSDSDNGRLAITLPLLAKALEYNTLPSPDDPMFHSIAEQLASIDNDLARYALGAAYESKSRSGAATCLHVYITHFARQEVNGYATKKVLEDVIVPGLWSAYDELKEKGSHGALEAFVDCLNLCSNIGSAAACRGGVAASIADALAFFFVELACTGKAEVPFTKERKRDNCKIDVQSLKSGGAGRGSLSLPRHAALSAAAAFGSMLQQDERPIWKQRMTHKTLTQLAPSMQAYQGQSANSSENSLGLVVVICHIVCSSNLKIIPLSKKGDMVKIIVHSLNTTALFNPTSPTPEMESSTSEIKRLAIASILRLSASNSGLLSSYSEPIMIGLLRAYATTDVRADVACKLLVLQVLERMCHTELRKKVMLTMQPAVVSILGAAMNHPSRLLRSAAVSVRNAWCTIE